MNDKQLQAGILAELKKMKRRIRTNNVPGYSKADQQHYIDAVKVIELLIEKDRLAAAKKIIDVINRVYY